MRSNSLQFIEYLNRTEIVNKYKVGNLDKFQLILFKFGFGNTGWQKSIVDEFILHTKDPGYDKTTMSILHSRLLQIYGAGEAYIEIRRLPDRNIEVYCSSNMLLSIYVLWI